MFFIFIPNIIGILSFSSLALFITSFTPKKYAPYIWGILFGLITIFVMSHRQMNTEGRYYDLRHITMTMAGFIGGPVSALIAAIISSTYRFYLGGVGTVGGTISIITFGCFGSLLGKYGKDRLNPKNYVYWFGIGIIMSVLLLIIIVIIPPWSQDLVTVLKKVSGPYLIITPLLVIIIFNLFLWLQQFIDSAFTFQMILKRSPLNILIFDERGCILNSANSENQQSLNHLIKNPLILLGNDIHSWFQMIRQDQREFATECGKTLRVDLASYKKPNGEYACLALLNDITDIKAMNAEMARLDRLNLVGQMAAGIGHEIRNPMTTVRGYLQLLGTKVQYQSQKPTFELMISELDRANSIIAEFLSLARTKETVLQLQSLNDILNQLYPLLEADSFNQNKQIEFLMEPIPDLKLNKKEISQLVLNLARNGLEAMAEGGRLTIKTYLKNDQVLLAIEDEGCGIPPKDLDKLGTPFFTTKEYGTGLGMVTCFKIIETHKAKIDIDSSPKGTKFFISFPIPEKVRTPDKMVI